MTDIVTRLRALEMNSADEAAELIQRLTAERDEARRLICNIISTASQQWSADVAEQRGWGYLFKEDRK